VSKSTISEISPFPKKRKSSVILKFKVCGWPSNLANTSLLLVNDY
jgi:hypothetical protein